MTDPQVSPFLWHDLTVPPEQHHQVRDFYTRVLGWQPEAVDMETHEDYSMIPAGGDQAVAGVCAARGMNAGLPPQWLIYVRVDDLDAALAAVVENGGAVVSGPHEMGASRYACMRDPAGAHMALFQGEPMDSAPEA